MASQPEVIQYDVGVYQIEVTDPVDGGVGAITNAPLLNLSNRTAWLKKHVDDLESGLTIPPTLAPKNSPALTGTPTAPTPALGDNSAKIATTAFVQGTVNGVTTKNVAGSANVTLTAIEAGAGILVFTGTLTGNISVIVPAVSKSWIVANQTSGLFTLTVKTAAGAGVAVARGKNLELWCDGSNVVASTTDFTDAELLGTPTAPTPASGDNSQKVASTGFVTNATDGMATVNVAGSSSVTVSPAQYGSAILKLTGAITANINLILPSQSGQWIIDNQSTGAFNITAKTATGTGVVLPNGIAVLVYCDGVNVWFASSSALNSFRTREIEPAAGTTELTVLGGYTPGNIQVAKNGSMLDPSDYTATNSTTITVAATTADDKFTIYIFSTFEVADALTVGDIATTAEAQAMTADNVVITPKKLGEALFFATGIQVYDTAGSFTFNVPDVLKNGYKKALVTVVGGGGSGGKTSNTNCAPGGGGGGMSRGLVDLSGVTSVAVTVGAGGAGVSAAADGNAGAASSFGSFMSATGAEGARPGGQSPGRGGSGTGGDINQRGGSGGANINPSGGLYGGSFGGASPMAPGGVASFGVHDPLEQNGSWPGGGGGGVTQAAAQSGSGATGAVIIQW